MPREIVAAQNELRRHIWDDFIQNPPSVAQGGNGVVVPGCPVCRKRLNTTSEYLNHLADDVLPVILVRIEPEPREKG